MFLNLHSEVLKYIIIKLDEKPVPAATEEVVTEDKPQEEKEEEK